MAVAQLSALYVDMERLRSTPQPVCFRVLLRAFTLLHLALLPLRSHDKLGYVVIPEGERAESDLTWDVFGSIQPRSRALGIFAAASWFL